LLAVAEFPNYPTYVNL